MTAVRRALRASRSKPGVMRAKVWEFVQGRLLAGEPPTVREVQEAMGFSAVQTARQHLEALVAEGRLLAERGRARGYRLAGHAGALAASAASLDWIPLLGRVQAGALTEAIAEADVEGYLPRGTAGPFRGIQASGAPRASFFAYGSPSGELFALTVQGESMTGAGILPGDIVIVRRRADVRDRDVVVAMAGGEATVKRLRITKGGRMELHAENPAFRPIVPEGDEEMTLVGKVIEVRRRMEGKP